MTAGSAGIEWYFGRLKPPNDLNTGNLRIRSKMWGQSAIARDFFEKLPYPEMVNMDEKLITGSGFVSEKKVILI